jgi:hypothetical protein
MVSEGLAVNDSRPSPEITRQGPQIQPFIQSQWITRHHARAMGAYVLRKAFLGAMADIQSA